MKIRFSKILFWWARWKTSFIKKHGEFKMWVQTQGSVYFMQFVFSIVYKLRIKQLHLKIREISSS